MKSRTERIGPMRYTLIFSAALLIAACSPKTETSLVSVKENVESTKTESTKLNKRTRQAKSLIETALAGTQGYDITESLTTEVGPRLAGTEAEARARDWAVNLRFQAGKEAKKQPQSSLPFRKIW